MKNINKQYLLTFIIVMFVLVIFYFFIFLVSTTPSTTPSTSDPCPKPSDPYFGHPVYTWENSEPKLDGTSLLMSQLCTQSQFESPLYYEWALELKRPYPPYHRKLWEYVYILQALKERGMLKPGRKGVGFGVGSEPLPSYFASKGVEVLATDMNAEEAKNNGWASTNQYMTDKEKLNVWKICDNETFHKLVSLRIVNMNSIPDDIKDYDFTWSSCSFEHAGSIVQGLQFFENSMKLLKPGGYAVHTTEYNVLSNDDTITTGGTVIFRRRDMEELARVLTKNGHEIYFNFHPGSRPLDKYIDLPPYKSDPHLKLKLDKYVTTSIGIIARKKLETPL